MGTSTLSTLTRATAVCTGCSAGAPVRSTFILRAVALEGYTGTPTATGTLDFLLPDGWIFSDALGGFLCESCQASGLNDGPNRS